MPCRIGQLLCPSDITPICVCVCMYFRTFGTTKWSRVTSYIFCPYPEVPYFSEESWFLLMGNHTHLLILTVIKSAGEMCLLLQRCSHLQARSPGGGSIHDACLPLSCRYACCTILAKQTTSCQTLLWMLGIITPCVHQHVKRLLVHTMRLSEESGVAPKQT